MAEESELLLEMIQAVLVFLPQIPAVVALGESIVKIVTLGVVTAAQEKEIRQQLDAVKTAIDGASP